MRAIRATLRRLPAVRKVVVDRRHRGLEPTDAFIASYPRSGNTWLRFVLAQLATGHPVDFEEVDRISPNVGAHAAALRPLPGGRRLIKTHERWRPEYRTAVYLVRDVRDVVVSWFRVTRRDPDRLDALDEFVRDFAAGRIEGYGAWDAHVRSWIDAAARGLGICIFRFEDLRQNPVAGVEEVAHVLGLEVEPDQIRRALDDNSAARMQELEKRNQAYLERSFGRLSTGVREGRAGTWRTALGDRHLVMLEPALELMRELDAAALEPRTSWRERT